jgi:flagellin
MDQQKASQRLSSGLRINSAADDAAGLAISEKMRAQIRGLDMATKNTQDAISLVQTAEGSMQEITNMAQRVRELTVQAANDTNEFEDRQKIGNEIKQLTDEIDAMAGRTEFNKKTLATGTYASGGGKSLVMQIGANSAQTISFNIGSLKATGLHASYKDIGDMLTKSSTSASDVSTRLLKIAESGIKVVTDERAKLGAIQNRLEYTDNSLKISSENLNASESRIRNADMGKEMMNLTQANILQQAAISMLAQANQQPQSMIVGQARNDGTWCANSNRWLSVHHRLSTNVWLF